METNDFVQRSNQLWKSDAPICGRMGHFHEHLERSESWNFHSSKEQSRRNVLHHRRHRRRWRPRVRSDSRFCERHESIGFGHVQQHRYRGRTGRRGAFCEIVASRPAADRSRPARLAKNDKRRRSARAQHVDNGVAALQDYERRGVQTSNSHTESTTSFVATGTRADERVHRQRIRGLFEEAANSSVLAQDAK